MSAGEDSSFTQWTTSNKQNLDSYIKEDNFQNDTYKVKIYNDTNFDPLEIYKVPVKILKYNFDNVRISAEKAKVEQDRSGVPLNPMNESDQKLVEQVLLTSKFYSKTATEDLLEDIKKKGLEEPAIVTIDGVIWNGNRRIAILNKLRHDTGEQKYDYVNIVRLPALSFKELKKLERRLQMQKDWKQSYGPIQTRLDIRQSLKDSSWTVPEIIASYGGRYDKDDLEKMREEIDLIDEYLVRIKRPKDYALIELADKGGGVETFTAIRDILKSEEKKQTKGIEQEKIKLACFRIKHHPESTYEHLRDFRKVLNDTQSRSEFIKNSDTFKSFNTITKSGNEFDNVSLKSEFDNLDASYEVIRNAKKDAKKLVEKALIILQSIKEDRIPKNNKEFKDAIAMVEKTVSSLKSKS